MAESEGQGTEQATPYKLQQARRRGSVAKSVEVNSLAIVSAFVVVIALWGKSIAQDELVIARKILEFAGRLDFSVPTIAALMLRAVTMSLAALAPLLLLLIVVGILSNLLQTGPVFSAFPLKPDFDRVNPFSGLSRLFSIRMLVESGKSILKLALMGAALYLVLVHSLREFAALNQTDPRSLLPFLLDQSKRTVAVLLPIIALVAAVDFIYTKWSFLGRMKMTRRELRDELKQREGDPRIRARIRELRQEMLKRSKSLKRVKDADVLITNPTHLAVALFYRKGEMGAPRVTAKGAGELALRMQVFARRSGVPVVADRALARRLYRSAGLDEPIPESLYTQVARLLAWVYATRRARPEGAT
jgi:flagellar biosynthesis protein FlhB